MPDAHPDKHRIPAPGKHGLPREPMRHILQSNAGTPALDPQRQHAIDEGMAQGEWQQNIAQGRGAAERRPPFASVAGRGASAALGGAVAEAGLAATVEAEREAGDDVGGEGQGDDQRLGERGLVVGPREEEVGVRRGEGAS